MAIAQGDIKLVASQVMTDVPNGGGAPTTTLILDAQTNAIMPDISELDRAGGRVNLRKTFAHIQTAGVEPYFGANFIVAEPPEDPNVSITIFSLGEVFDRRVNAASRMESYLNAQAEIPGFLYENHIQGQRVIQILMRVGAAPPTVGHTYVLRKREGFGDQVEQYVRTTRVASEQRTFTDSLGDFYGIVHTCDISDELRDDFPGTTANRLWIRPTEKTIIRDTVVANANTFCGAAALAEEVEIGDTGAVAETVHSRLVPSAQTETPLIDQIPAQSFVSVLASAPRQVLIGGAPLSQRIKVGQENRAFNYTTILSPLPAPGSVRVTYRALGSTYEITDDGAGNLTNSGSGTVNYTTGSVVATLNALPDDRSGVIFSWGPKVAYTNRAGSLEYRPPEYAFDLEHPGVTPGSLEITWDSGGVTKTAVDNGTGKITGHAVGEIVYATGMVYLRPTAMLDAGGEFAIEYTWSTLVEEAHPGLTVDGAGAVSVTLASTPVAGTVQVQWLTTRTTSTTGGSTSSAGSTQKGSMSNSNAENTTSTTTAMVDVTKNYRSMTADVVAAYNSPTETSSVSFSQEGMYGQKNYEVTTKVPVTTTTSHSTSGTGSSSSSNGSTYSTASAQTSSSAITTSHQVTDDGAGNFFGTLGTIGYVSKAVVIKVQTDVTESSYQSNHESAENFESLNATGEATTTAGNTSSGGVSTNQTTGGGGSTTAKGGAYGSSAQKDVFGGNSLFVRYRTGSPTPTAHSETYTPPGITLDLCPRTTDTVVPHSVRFTWMGVTYEDFEGVIYRGRTSEDPGIACGRMIYTSGNANMNDYIVGANPATITINSLWTRKPREHVANVTYQTALAPIKPTGLTQSVIDTSGTQLIATADLDGIISGPHTHGKIDYDTGLVECQFGDYVLDSGLTAAQKAEWWYDADNVRTADGKIWRPWPVDPETVRYNAVAFFYLPLDAAILGLDPVRLPQDGRVPIFRSGGFAVLGHTDTVGPLTVSNAQVVDCERVRLSRVRVIDDDGLVINTGYTVDLEDGTVTFTDVASYSQPITVEHRVEDMVMVAEVQIDGRMTFTRAVTHDYPVPGSYISSALVAGDMQTNVELMFDQVTWTGVWSDAQIGSAATATYNDISNPIVVTNRGTITERWAIIVNTGGTTFNVVGEHVGVIAVGNFTTTCAPVNPATGYPYFSIPAAGWGSGWAAGNVVRFNTIGAIYPIWIVRTIQQGPVTVDQDKFTLLIRGDVDRP